MKYGSIEEYQTALKLAEEGASYVSQGAARVGHDKILHSQGFSACTACIVINKKTGDSILFHLDRDIYSLSQSYSWNTMIGIEKFMAAEGDKEAMLIHGQRYNVSNVMNAEDFLRKHKVPLLEELTVASSKYWWALSFNPVDYELTIFNQDDLSSKPLKPFGEKIKFSNPEASLVSEIKAQVQQEEFYDNLAASIIYGTEHLLNALEVIKSEGQNGYPTLPEMFSALTSGKRKDDNGALEGYNIQISKREPEKTLNYMVRFQETFKLMFDIFKDKYPNNEVLAWFFNSQISHAEYFITDLEERRGGATNRQVEMIKKFVNSFSEELLRTIETRPEIAENISPGSLRNLRENVTAIKQQATGASRA